MDWMESYRESSANFSAKVSCGIIRGSNEGTHDSQGINIPGRNLAVVSVLLDTKALQENQVYEVKPNLLLTNEHPNLVVLPMLHLVQKEKHDSIPVALINLNEDERIFLKK